MTGETGSLASVSVSRVEERVGSCRAAVALSLILAVTAGCGAASPGAIDGALGDAPREGPADPSVAAGDNGTGAGAGSGGSGDQNGGPISVTVEGTTYAIPPGTCSVSDDEIMVEAGGSVDNELRSLAIRWRAAADGSVNDERFGAYNSGGVSGPPAPFELVANPSMPETRWNVIVNGSDAEITATMGNVLPAALTDDPAIKYLDVVISLDC